MTRRIRIAALLTDPAIGGDENRLLAFAGAMDRERFSLAVIALHDFAEVDPGRYGPILERYRRLDVELISLGERRRCDRRALPRPLSLARDAGRGARVVARLARVLRAGRFDVLDCRMNYMIAIGVPAARLAGTRAVTATEYVDAFWERQPWRALAPALFDGLDALVSDSQWAIDHYRTLLRRPLDHAVVIPNGVPEPVPTLDRARVRAMLGLPPTPVRVVAQVARLVPFKGQRVLLDAAAEVLRTERDVAFLVCGFPGPNQAYRRELERRAESLGIADRFRIAGWPGDIADVWATVDVHAHPSLLDSSPIAIHESMALGLPAVVTSAGGIPELVIDGETGLVVPPGDARALAAAIRRLLGDADTARRLGAGARRRWQLRSDPRAMAAAIEALFVRALAGDERRWN
jgi:glycosyltransferase involved in cell wall biosynthesis